MNDYPFLDNKMHPLCDAELGDIVPPVRQSRIIDISKSPLVPARELREKLDHLLVVGELDSGLPIVRNDVLVGLIPVPDLEFALDKLKDEESAMCIMSADTSWAAFDSDDDNRPGPADFTPYIDPVCHPIPSVSMREYILKPPGSYCSRYTFPRRLGLPVLCQIGPALLMRPPRWTVRRARP